VNEKRKAFILLIIITFLFSISHLPPLKNYFNLDQIYNIKNTVDHHLFLGPILFVVISSFLVMVGIPKSIICITGGIIFDFWKGLILATIGIISGSFIIFIIARLLGAPFFYKKLEGYLQVIKEYKGNQFIMVLLIKQVPIPCLLNNTLLGLTSVSAPIFIIGSLIGQLPTNVIFTLYGSSIHGNTILKISLATSIATLFFVALKYIISRLRFLKKIN